MHCFTQVQQDSRGHSDASCPAAPPQDALLALSESTKVFILYLTATAATHQAAARRQTLLEADVFAALRDIQFGDFVRPLKDEAAGDSVRPCLRVCRAHCIVYACSFKNLTRSLLASATHLGSLAWNKFAKRM